MGWQQNAEKLSADEFHLSLFHFRWKKSTMGCERVKVKKTGADGLRRMYKSELKIKLQHYEICVTGFSIN